MYVDRLDLSTVDFTRIGGMPPHKFAVSAWTYDAVQAVLPEDKITDKKYGKLHVSSTSFLCTTFFNFDAA